MRELGRNLLGPEFGALDRSHQQLLRVLQRQTTIRCTRRSGGRSRAPKNLVSAGKTGKSGPIIGPGWGKSGPPVCRGQEAA
eukprot:6343465-Pyramimonas_sp.AAC.1